METIKVTYTFPGLNPRVVWGILCLASLALPLAAQSLSRLSLEQSTDLKGWQTVPLTADMIDANGRLILANDTDEKCLLRVTRNHTRADFGTCFQILRRRLTDALPKTVKPSYTGNLFYALFINTHFQKRHVKTSFTYSPVRPNGCFKNLPQTANS